MMIRGLFFTLTLLAGVSKGDDQASIQANHRDLQRGASEKLPKCEGTAVSLYYNLFITVQSASKDEDCDFDDFVNMGIELESIVVDIEENFPTFEEEYLDTKVCPVPRKLDARRSARKGKRARKLASSDAPIYEFTTSGRGRACDHDDTSRRLGDSEDEKIKDAAEEACNFADMASFGATAAKRSFKNCDEAAEAIQDLAPQYNDKKVGEEYIEDAKEMLKNCKDAEYTARRAAQMAPDWCEMAHDATTLTEAEHSAKEAKQLSFDAVGAAKLINAEYENMKLKKADLTKMILEQNFELQRKEFDDVVEVEQKNRDFMDDEIKTRIQSLDDVMIITKDGNQRAKLSEQKDTLVQLEKEKKKRTVEMEKEIQQVQETYEEQLEDQIEDANILIEIQDELAVRQSMKVFGDMLEKLVPGRLLEKYNTKDTEVRGCLKVEPIVTVRIEEKVKWSDTLRGRCDIPSK